MAQDVQDMMLASDQPELNTTQSSADQNQNTNQTDPNNHQASHPQQDPTMVGNDAAGAPEQQQQGTTNAITPFVDEEE
jgi:hypothetical protein